MKTTKEKNQTSNILKSKNSKNSKKKEKKKRKKEKKEKGTAALHRYILKA